MAGPRYFDGVLAAFHAGQAGRDVHLGFWATPAEAVGVVEPGEWAAAQAALTARVIGLAPVRAGARVLDVGCGLGGTLEALAAEVPGVALVGVNIDWRQLAVCGGIAVGGAASLALVAADAGALPFRDGAFDQVFCVEAMFHFESRAGFLAEAARVLRPGGALVLSDILIRAPGGSAPWTEAVMAGALRRDYGPWPEVWTDAEAVRRAARGAGLGVVEWRDWTAETWPSYRITAPGMSALPSPHSRASEVMRWLHGHGWLDYVAVVFQRG